MDDHADNLHDRIRASEDGIIDLPDPYPAKPKNAPENGSDSASISAPQLPATTDPSNGTQPHPHPTRTLGNSALRWDKYTLEATKKLIPKEVSTPDPTSIQGFYDPKSLTPDNPEPTFLPFIWDPEGFPTIDAVPIWERMVGEDVEHFEAFRRYLALSKPRDLRTLALDVTGDVEVLIILANLWQWPIRAYHYDRFIDARVEQKRTEVKVEVEQSHRRAAKRLLDKAFAALDATDSEAITPEEALKLAKLGLEVERVAVGMDKEKPRETVPPTPPKEAEPTIQVAGQNVQINWKRDFQGN